MDMIMLSIECLVDNFVIVGVIWMAMVQSVCSFVLLISSDYRERADYLGKVFFDL